MADFGFANKSNSSDFSSTGDKVNEIFGDLLLNRTELEAMITSLKRRQYGATPPANPNTGDIWECSTTGGGYTATVAYRYNGSAWLELVAAAINVANRNTVLQGKVDAIGNPDLFEAGTGLAVKLNATATPAIFAFMNGNSTSLGTVDIVAAVSADAATFWSSLPTSSTVYLYVDYTAGTVSGGFTTAAPMVSNVAPTHASGLHWLDFNTGKVWSSDGSAWTQRNRIFVGTATTDGSGVTAVDVYAYNVTQEIKANDIITKGPWVDVRKFGAVGDGVTDDTAAIQEAMDYALLNGKTLYFPAANGPYTPYIVSDTILISGTELNIEIRGDKGTTIRKGSGDYPIFDLASNVPYTGAYAERITNVYITDLIFTSPDATGTGIKISTFGRIYFKNLYAYGFNVGYDLIGGSEMWLDEVEYAGGNLGFRLDASVVDMQTVYFNGLLCTNCVYGVSLISAYDVHFNRSFFGGCSGRAIVAGSVTNNIYFAQCHFEWMTNSGILLNYFIGAVFDKCEFAQAAVGQAPPIEVNNSFEDGKLVIKDCFHETLGQMGLVYVRATSKNVNIVLRDNKPELMNSAVNYEKGTNVKTFGLPIDGKSINAEVADFSKGFLGHPTTYATVALSLDSSEYLTGTSSVKFPTTNGYWNYAIVNFIGGEKITIDVILKGTGYSSGIMRGVLASGGDEVIFESMSRAHLVEEYPNGFKRFVMVYTVPQGDALTIIRVSNSQNPSVNLYVDYLNIYTTGEVIKRDISQPAAPTEGAFPLGDIVYNSEPTAGGNVGWVCTTAGTPGTWQPFGIAGAIQGVADADSTATDIAGLKADLNDLLAKLRAAKLIAT